MMARRAVWVSVCLLGIAVVGGAHDRRSLTDATQRARGNNHAIRNNIHYLFRPTSFTSLGVGLQHPLLRNRAIDPARPALRVTALDRDRSGAVLAR